MVRVRAFSTFPFFLMGTVTAPWSELRLETRPNSGQTHLSILWKNSVQEQENGLGRRGTGRPKSVGIGAKPHGSQGCVKVGFELDYGKDVFEADDMVEWEGVEGRRRGGNDSRVCPCCSLRRPLWPSSAHRRATGVGSELGVPCNGSRSYKTTSRSLFVRSRVVALPCILFPVPSSSLIA